MGTKSFKIRTTKLLNKTDKGYVFTSSKKNASRKIYIPKSQVVSYKQETINNPYTGGNERWINISVTEWIWFKAKLEDKLKHHGFSNDVVIEGESHFGIKWNFVIMKKKNTKNCFWCHSKLNTKNKTVDHLIPRSILKAYGYTGGIRNNTVPCCFECNQEKANLHPEVFRELVVRKISETGHPRYRVILFNLNQLLITKE